MTAKILPMRCKQGGIDRRRDCVRDRAGARIFLLLIAACAFFWYGVFKLIF
jgi:hypothetical protein